MEREFWKQSAASLRESKTKEHNDIDKRSVNNKTTYDEKNSLKPLRQLENAYGKFIFGLRNDKYAVMISRKNEFKEETFENSRETLNENRLNEKKISGGRTFVDSHKKEDSAVIYEESIKNAPAERIFKDLKYAAKNSDKITLKEMMPEKFDVEKKIFQNIKSSVEMLSKNTEHIDEIPFFKRVMNNITEEIDADDHEDDKNS